MEPLAEDFMIDDWRVQPSRLRIIRGSEVREVDPKPMAVLVALAAASGEVVTREQLFDEVWDGAVVVDGALTRCISELRKAFGDKDHKSVIETVRGIGYRLAQVPTAVATSAPRQTESMIRPGQQSMVARAGAATVAVAVVAVGAWLLIGGRAIPESYAVHSLNAQAGLETNARISPDGKLVAYTWPGQSPDASVYVQPADSIAADVSPFFLSGPIPGAGGLAWSPDGQRLALMVHQGDECTIRIIRIADRSSRSGPDCGSNYYRDLEWSPDGQSFLYSDKLPSGAFGIFSVSIDGRIREQLTNPTNTKYGDHFPAFSADGSRLAFVRTQFEDAADIYVASPDGTNERRVTSEYRTITGIDWRGKSIVFSSNKGGPFQLWTARADAAGQSKPRWLPLGAAAAHAPSIDAAGNTIIFQSDLSIVNVKTWADNTPDRVIGAIASARLDSAPSVSPDGNWIVFVSARTGNRELWLHETSTGQLTQLTRMGGAFVDSPSWSADGRNIVFSASIDANSDVYAIDVATGSITQLTDDPADDLLPRYTPEATSVAFATDRSGTWQIVSKNLETGLITPLTIEGGLAIRFDERHDRMLVAGPHYRGIRVLEPGGRLGDLVAPDLHELDWGGWDVTDDGIVFVTRDLGAAAIARLRWDAADPEVLIRLEEHSPWSFPWAASTLDATPDGSIVYFSFYDVAESEIVRVTPEG